MFLAEWTPQDWIALAGLGVAALGLIAAPLSAWLLQRRRLAHERRESLTTTTAAAYSLSRRALVVLSPDRVPTDDERREVVRAALEELQVVEAVGWTNDVQRTAKGLLDAVDFLDRLTWTFHSTVLGGGAEARARGELYVAHQKAEAVLGQFRDAIQSVD
jgi:hypothetical protein